MRTDDAPRRCDVASPRREKRHLDDLTVAAHSATVGGQYRGRQVDTATSVRS